MMAIMISAKRNAVTSPMMSPVINIKHDNNHTDTDEVFILSNKYLFNNNYSWTNN